MKMLMPILFLASAACIVAQGPRPGQVKTCAEISLARPGFGESYRGSMRIDDYKLSLAIPAGLTGWGADPVAPFHGFTIFLPSDDDQPSCIMFEIYLRVDLGQREATPRGTRVMIGAVPAWKEEATGTINGTDFTNLTVRLSVAHGQEVDDGTVRLVTPTKGIGRQRSVFDGFLAQLKFDRRSVRKLWMPTPTMGSATSPARLHDDANGNHSADAQGVTGE
jgi:hypothetical protein